MGDNFNFGKIFGMFFVFLFLVVTQFNFVSPADACNNECKDWEYCDTVFDPTCLPRCNLIATSNVFKVVNNNGRECMRIDQDGDVWFSNYPVPSESGLFDQPGRDEFVIGGPSNTLLLIDSEDCATFFRGTINGGQGSISTGSGEFIIKNSGGTNVAKIDANGNFYAVGWIAQGCSCEAGTYSNPVDVRGNTILKHTSWGETAYAEGWCRVHKGCFRDTSVLLTTNDQNSCRCHPDVYYGSNYGCFSSSCTTSSTDWERYGSITCADHCTASSDCASGKYCDVSGECLDLPLCAEPNSATGYNAQESGEDLYGDCDTVGCGTGTCDGSYDCGYYTSGQRNCNSGYECDSSGTCVQSSECTYDFECGSNEYCSFGTCYPCSLTGVCPIGMTWSESQCKCVSI